MSQPLSFPRPRMRSEDMVVRDVPGELPKRVPGAALRAVPGARSAGPAEVPPRLDWRPYPPAPPRRRGRPARLFAAVRSLLRGSDR